MRLAAVAVFATIVLGGFPGLSLAAAKSPSEAKAFYDKATAAFGLGQYEEAADNYEQAFKLKPDPALLYNAAQAHRLGGNNKRALELYRSYMRVFPNGAAHEEATKHAEALSQKLAQDEAAKAAPAPVSSPAPMPSPPPDPGPQDSANTAILAAKPEPRTAPEQTSMFSRPVFWIVAGVVVVAAAVGIGILASGDKDPSPSLGSIGGSR